MGPFSMATCQIKYLTVAVHYFTKWIEAKVEVNIGMEIY